MATTATASAVQQLITSNRHILDLGGEQTSEWEHCCNLALQVLHTLQHQHRWTQLRLHTHAPASPHLRLSRPMLSGLPPRRLYVHPDEQIEHLKLEDERRGRRGKAQTEQEAACGPANGEERGGPDENGGTALESQPVREWVLPTHIRESTSLRKISAVFDGICAVPPQPDPLDHGLLAKHPPTDQSLQSPDKWRQTKRLLLAIVDDDSTVVFYIVHDGMVKPRQN